MKQEMKGCARWRALVADSGAGGFVLPAAEIAPAYMAFENDHERVEILMEAMRKLQPVIVKRLGAFRQVHADAPRRDEGE